MRSSSLGTTNAVVRVGTNRRIGTTLVAPYTSWAAARRISSGATIQLDSKPSGWVAKSAVSPVRPMCSRRGTGCTAARFFRAASMTVAASVPHALSSGWPTNSSVPCGVRTATNSTRKLEIGRRTRRLASAIA